MTLSKNTKAQVGDLRITLAIATLGRPQDLGHSLNNISQQTRQPDKVLVSATGPGDIDETAVRQCCVPVKVLFGTKGLTRQRNLILDHLDDTDVILFLDDDFVMAPDYLQNLESLFFKASRIAVATGDVQADGIGGAGLTHDAARRILAAAPHSIAADLTEVNNAYGCNMAFRAAPIRDNALRFDENLPLYGWLEDVDFSRRVAAFGHCVKAASLRGVHLGTKAGRTSGIRLGYSQVANPFYLVRGAIMKPGHALRLAGGNMLANAVKSLRPEPWIDRRGRLRGNFAAIADLLRGSVHPLRVLDLERPDQ
ncbi:glycosyltransferase family 2 protein [Loktanella sp. R86503]|uniref:glycosyltransferase family 2 protein n=1 Tax=Loktanella sp. R86503 TaxID=3093847 RepID=UPI0036DBF2DA